MTNRGSLFSFIFYYYRMKLNRSGIREYMLCILACSDLTFASLNSDLYFLKEMAAVLNVTRVVVFLFVNCLIFTYLSQSISILNIIMSLILIPLPFIYKIVAPR